MEIEITWYKKSMKDQVIALFENQYKTPSGYFEDLFEKFYFHSYQENRCLMIVALDGSTIAGFQSFFHWPYTYNEKTFNSYQSGNSLVHPDYRGKGVFQKMLSFIEQEKKNLGLDFFIGFPIDASINNLLKDKWKNILNLNWLLKICNPLGFFNLNPNLNKNLQPGLVYLNPLPQTNSKSIRLSTSKDFINWRDNYLLAKKLYYSYSFKKESTEIIFHIKKNKRKIFNEIIIGNILFNSNSAQIHLKEALRQLNRQLIKSFSCHFVSCALNIENQKDIVEIFENTGYKKINKTVYFAIKLFQENESILEPKNWELYRSDIDTW